MVNSLNFIDYINTLQSAVDNSRYSFHSQYQQVKGGLIDLINTAFEAGTIGDLEETLGSLDVYKKTQLLEKLLQEKEINEYYKRDLEKIFKLTKETSGNVTMIMNQDSLKCINEKGTGKYESVFLSIQKLDSSIKQVRYCDFGVSLSQNGEYIESIPFLQESLIGTNGSAAQLGNLYLGLAYAFLSENDKAKKYFMDVSRTPDIENKYSAYVNLGVLYINEENYLKAKEILNKALNSEIIDTIQQASFWKAACCLKLGQIDEKNFCLEISKNGPNQFISTKSIEALEGIENGKSN